MVSALLQLIVAGCLWSESRIKDGDGLGVEGRLIVFVLCGASLLCALDGVHAPKIWQRIVGVSLALFPAFLLAAWLYFLMSELLDP